MIVGINICGTEKENGQPDKFIVDCFTKIGIKHSEHQFVFIIDRPIEENEKSVFIRLSPRPKSAFFWKFWYKYTLAPAIKKQKIDLLINCNGICALNSKISQMLFINDMPVLATAFGTKKNDWFYKKHTAHFLQKATSVLTISNFLKQELIAKYGTGKQKINVIYPAIDKTFKSVSFDQKEKIKEIYTGGKEFFLYAGDINAEKNLISLLKAFSFFKKRQKSNMQLVLLAETINDAGFIESLKTYKYREEVKLLQDISVDDQAKITASAYAFVYPSSYEPFPKKILEAMQAGVPVIANYLPVISETCEDAIEYANTNNFEEIADKMMLLFKDENRRNELIAKGSKQILPYKADKMAEDLWQSIIKTTPV